MTITQKRMALIATVSLLGMMAAGCNKSEPTAADNVASTLDATADAVRDQGEVVADKMEDNADALNKKIDAAGDNTADHIERKADELRDKVASSAAALENRADAVTKAAKAK